MGAVAVFLSHKGEDAPIAKRVADRLRLNDVDAYLDVIDSQLVKDGPELADYLRMRLGECSDLMAVVSAATKESWWVPWEIGVATEKNYSIATFLAQDVVTPGYLQKWPYLRTGEDIDTYAQITKRMNPNIMLKSRVMGRLDESVRREVRSFHRTLKQALRQ